MTLRKNARRFWIGIGLLIALAVALWFPTPYYIMQPGTIEGLAPRITVENGKKSEKGSFNLTTVLSMRADHFIFMLYGWLIPHSQLVKVTDVRGSLTDPEYNRLLDHMMATSQQNAVVAGLHGAGETVEVKNRGVFVAQVLPNSKAKGIIAVGDVILAADGHPMSQASDFVAFLTGNKKAGDKVELRFEHDGKERTAGIELITIDVKTNRAGVGITPEDVFTIDAPRKIAFETAGIGGPSAGLMFSLEIANQLLPGDLTGGYKIAGTGTIDRDGNVGQIGGIRDKIIAARNAGVDIFLCPADIRPGDSNEKDIKDEAKREGIAIKIVPVKTMREALDYLRALPPKT